MGLSVLIASLKSERATYVLSIIICMYVHSSFILRRVWYLCPPTQEWRKLDCHEPCPVERSCHAAVCIGYGLEHPQLLVIGGWDENLEVLNDCWMLDIMSGNWREVRLQKLRCVSMKCDCKVFHILLRIATELHNIHT